MYDETLALAVPGAIAIGTLHPEHWWLGAAAIGLIAAAVVLLRLRRRRAER
jgi:hypothetical protein